VLSLTFDDGPDPVWTPAVLAELARCGARATFFVVVPRAARRPGLVRRMLAEGHGVELHCWSHERHTRCVRRRVEDETDRALATLAGMGVRPRLWRTPWGDRAPWTGEVARARGLTPVGWTADTHDWRGDAAPAMLAAVRPALGPGGSVLMHDGLGPGALRADCRETVRLVGPLCRLARDRGWRVGPMPAPGPAA
jgi:peptidoglycan-N-acetylglucosamine deacetylase